MTRRTARRIAVAAILFLALATLSPRLQSGRNETLEPCERACAIYKNNCMELCGVQCAELFDPEDPETKKEFQDCDRRCRAGCRDLQKDCLALCKIEEPGESPL